ncbi:MAG: YbjQ family protein [Candidatus Brocadiaceae bacterium]|nr:YbjQ family protein [Candidatus Brocadiaceae bacterium]
MIVATTETVAGRRVVETLGIVRGNTIRARHIGRDITAVLRNVVGGEIPEYTKLLGEAREQALDRMIQNAEELGANAIIGVRFATSTVTTGAAELLAYGTAVILE